MFASEECLVTIIVLDHILKIWIELKTLPNDNAMEKFYGLWWFSKKEILVELFIFWKFRKFKRKALPLYELSERESGGRFTARCHTRPKQAEFFYNIDLFRDVFEHKSYYYMKKNDSKSILHVLNFHFVWVWASCDHVIRISTWLQILVRGSFLEVFFENFQKTIFSQENNLILKFSKM